MSVSEPLRSPRFCGQCGASLPPGNPRFCIECGKSVRSLADDPPPPAALRREAASTGPTVRLPNARGEQVVVGGTVKLPSDGAIPPGLWFGDAPPGPEDTVALYAPLRAVVGGWSGTTSDGWAKAGQEQAIYGTRRELVRFEAKREWFPAPGCGHGMRLVVEISALASAERGRTRRGFRYRVGENPPMEVRRTHWVDSTGKVQQHLPEPIIQLMAPPRVGRISDYDEEIRTVAPTEAAEWARQGVVRGVFRLESDVQQRTPVGRGLPLLELPGGETLLRLTGLLFQPYRVRMMRPYVFGPGQWAPTHARMQSEARGLGLDMNTDAVAEWWLDRNGYDGAVFENGAHPDIQGRMVVAFRRADIVQVQLGSRG